MNSEENKIGIKRRADKISIESPIMARLEIEKVKGKIIAKMIFANTSEQNVIVDEHKLGGEKLREHIFHLNPWYTSPNITFKPYKSLIPFGTSPKYTIMKPQQVIVTETNLNKYYDFTEKKYDTLTISYVTVMDYCDESYKQITKRDEDGIVKPVVFHIRSNKVRLDYNKDIKPYL